MNFISNGSPSPVANLSYPLVPWLLQSLSASGAEDAKYPHPFELQVKVELGPGTFTQELQVLNSGGIIVPCLRDDYQGLLGAACTTPHVHAGGTWNILELQRSKAARVNA